MQQLQVQPELNYTVIDKGEPYDQRFGLWIIGRNQVELGISACRGRKRNSDLAFDIEL